MKKGESEMGQDAAGRKGEVKNGDQVSGNWEKKDEGVRTIFRRNGMMRIGASGAPKKKRAPKYRSGGQLEGRHLKIPRGGPGILGGGKTTEKKQKKKKKGKLQGKI